MQLAVNILFFFIMPVFWLGLIRTYLTYRRRVNRERKLFDSAINPHHTEIRTFVIALIVLGIVGSFLTSLLGIEVNYSWVFLYEGLATIGLLIPGLMFPFTLMLISIIVLVLLGDQFLYLILSGNFYNFLPEHTSMNMDFLALITVMMVLQYLFLKLNVKSFVSPIIQKNVRGNKVASYLFDKLTVVPLVLFVPGDLFTSTSAFWPIFKIFGVKLSILVVPVLIGFNFKFLGQMSEKTLKKITKAIGWLVWLSLGLTLDAFLWKNALFDLAAVLLIGLSYWLVLHYYKKVDQKDTQVEQSVDGIRVLGVKANTPASKMNLKIGDLIQEVNGQPVRNENQLYQALQNNPTYCRLKIKNRDGRLELKETAIFADAPHEIGIVTFPIE
ncbi:PDZ domain-containing protein [Fructilactobacillus frigidiflavus]|uniref:PDZ domain-containing protein n=1 Tax=Fructilactobacillus frigidiflavus TaxID=3242688 RepID=UPI003756A41C